MTVVRNAAYQAGGFDIRERHNERKNECYGNGDIDLARAELNVHYKRCLSPDGAPETYQQTFNRWLDEGVIVKRGLKPDAKVFDELVFDVNTSYFENHGGYDYAKRFYEEAYRMAVEAVGGEEYILSAVMHADERNKPVSEQLGRDVYHYHLHVTYVPVVRKEIYYQKSNKDPELAGKLKEVVMQISHSKKWPKFKDSKGRWVNSYSLLQDKYYDHMRAAGFEGFERGTLGSTKEHLTDLEYKTQQEQKRAAELAEKNAQAKKELETAQNSLASAKNQVAATDKQLAEKKKKLHVAKVSGAAFVDIENAAKPTFIGDKVTVDRAEWAKIEKLAKLGVVADEKQQEADARVAAYKKSAEQAQQEIARIKRGVKSGDLSVVYSFDEKIQMGKDEAARHNAGLQPQTVSKNTNRGAI